MSSRYRNESQTVERESAKEALYKKVFNLLSYDKYISEYDLARSINADEIVVKMIIYELRLRGVPIVSGKYGFKLASTKAELDDNIARLEARASKMVNSIVAMKRTSEYFVDRTK